MEGGVENEYLGHIRHYIEAAADSHKMRRGVQRSEGNAFFELRQDFVINKGTFKEVRTAGYDAVADRFDLIHRFDNAGFLIGKVIDKDLCGDGMVGHRDFLGYLLSLFTLAMLDVAVDADTLADTLGQALLLPWCRRAGT
jgi:hypothetical protein